MKKKKNKNSKKKKNTKWKSRYFPPPQFFHFLPISEKGIPSCSQFSRSPLTIHHLIWHSQSVTRFWLSVRFSHSVVSDSWWPHGLQHARLPCPSPTPRDCLNSYPWSHWCHPTISSSVIPLSSCLQSFPASGSFPVSQFLTSGGQSIEVSASASVLPMNIQDWFPLGWTGLISLQSKGLSRVFSNTTVQKHQFWLYSTANLLGLPLSSLFLLVRGIFKNANQIMSLPYLSLFSSFLLHLE